MKHTKIWIVVGALDVLFLAVIIFGLWMGETVGMAIAVCGVIAITGVTIGRMIESSIAGVVLGSIASYLIFDCSLDRGFVGLLIGGALGLTAGMMIEGWKKREVHEFDRQMKESRATIERNRIDIPFIMDNLDDTLDHFKQYILKYDRYKRELVYIGDRLKKIRYSEKNLASLIKAAATYRELRENLDRMEREIKVPYRDSSAWEFDVQKYRSGLGKIDSVTASKVNADKK